MSIISTQERYMKIKLMDPNIFLTLQEGNKCRPKKIEASSNGRGQVQVTQWGYPGTGHLSRRYPSENRAKAELHRFHAENAMLKDKKRLMNSFLNPNKPLLCSSRMPG
jgi:hypothetical protein